MKLRLERGRAVSQSESFLLSRVLILPSAFVVASCSAEANQGGSAWFGWVFWGVLFILGAWSFINDSVRRRRAKRAIAAFAQQRGLELTTATSLAGYLAGMRVSLAYQFRRGRNGLPQANIDRFEFSAYAHASTNWPAESTIVFMPSWQGGASSWLGARTYGVPTMVDPEFDRSTVALTRFPVPAMPVRNQRLDGPHFSALPHHSRLSHLPVSTLLQRAIHGRAEWTVSVYAGRVLVRGVSAGPDANEFSDVVTIASLMFEHMDAWASGIRSAQAGASQGGAGSR